MFKKKTKITLIILFTLSIFMIIINLIPPQASKKENPFISKTGLPMLAAHRGGSINSPENTLNAYYQAINEYKVDIFETDMWLTKDKKHLVLNHDGTLNRTSDAEEIEKIKNPNYAGEPLKISDYTYEELKLFNFGQKFVDTNGQYPYYYEVKENNINSPERLNFIKENKLGIVTIDELFENFYQTNPNLLFIVEIKNSGEDGKIAAKILDDILTKQYPLYKDRVVVGTFHAEVAIDLENNHNDIARGASTLGAAGFILTQLFGVNNLVSNQFSCLQIPMKQSILDLTLDMYIEKAHKKNIAVQYWTINDDEDMRYLINKGADAIMTDDPKLLRDVLNSYM